MAFKSVDIKSMNMNPFEMVGDKWMLVTGGNADGFNTMTASWGTFGVLWGKLVSQCFIRPSRYTYGFMEQGDYYTLCIFGEGYRKALAYCGSKSGRDVDKVRETNLTPAVHSTGAIYFEEAELVFVCKKIYYQDFDSDKFLVPEIEENYPIKDYHRIYIGEIVDALKKE